MNLSAVIEAANAKLDELGVTAPRFVGAEHLAKNAAPPRIVWAPGARDTYGPPRTTGANPRHLRTRHASLVATIWGKTLAEAEELHDRVVEAVHAVQHGNYQVNDAEWFGVDGDLVKLGFAVRIGFTLQIPVTERSKTTITIATVAQTTAIEDP